MERTRYALTDKSARRLDAILRAWRWALAGKQFGRVRYLCSPRALPYVSRAVERTSTDGLIEIEPLTGEDGFLELGAWHSPSASTSRRPGRNVPPSPL